MSLRGTFLFKLPHENTEVAKSVSIITHLLAKKNVEDIFIFPFKELNIYTFCMYQSLNLLQLLPE